MTTLPEATITPEDPIKMTRAARKHKTRAERHAVKLELAQLVQYRYETPAYQKRAFISIYQ